MSKDKIAEAKFDSVYAQMKKLEAEGKGDEAKSLLRSFLDVTEPVAAPALMVAESKKANEGPRNTKIKLLRECLIDGMIQPVGMECQVTEAVAKEFCDRKIRGYHPFYGYMPEIGPLMDEVMSGQPTVPNMLDRRQIVRAVRVQQHKIA